MFVKPEGTDLPAGRLARVLVGFHNNGTDGDFVIQHIEGSFRYPQDFSYHIQNVNISSCLDYDSTIFFKYLL